MTSRHLLVWLLVLLVAVVSGVQVSYSAQEVRRLHAVLEESIEAQDSELAHNSRLLLERSALAAYQNVEHTAQSKLQMRFPASVEQVVQ